MTLILLRILLRFNLKRANFRWYQGFEDQPHPEYIRMFSSKVFI